MVLKKDGLCYVDFLREECDSFGQGVSIGAGGFLYNEDGEEVLYVHYNEDEVEEIIKKLGFKFIYRENRTISRINENIMAKTSHIDFILQKY